jgi:hydrogenase-4 component B
MQYTGSSFAEPLTTTFQPVLRTARVLTRPAGWFPHAARLRTATPEPARDFMYHPFASRLDRALAHARWLQHGRIHLYVLYIALTLLALLIWKVGIA